MLSEALEYQRFDDARELWEEAADERLNEELDLQSLEEHCPMAEIIYSVGFKAIDAEDQATIESGDQLDLQLQVTCGIMHDTRQEAWDERSADTDVVYEVQLRRIPTVRLQVCIDCSSPDIDTRPLMGRRDGEETINLWKCGQCSRVAEAAKVVFLPEECEVTSVH